jgi:hypothetical protein
VRQQISHPIRYPGVTSGHTSSPHFASPALDISHPSHEICNKSGDGEPTAAAPRSRAAPGCRRGGEGSPGKRDSFRRRSLDDAWTCHTATKHELDCRPLPITPRWRRCRPIAYRRPGAGARAIGQPPTRKLRSLSQDAIARAEEMRELPMTRGALVSSTVGAGTLAMLLKATPAGAPGASERAIAR